MGEVSLDRNRILTRNHYMKQDKEQQGREVKPGL
jgi:hypothetical protein